MSTKTIEKAPIIEEYKQNEKDTGSPEVQTALCTARIRHLTEHLRTHRKDYHTRRGLIHLTNRRRKLLNYIKRKDLDGYNAIIKKLGIRR